MIRKINPCVMGVTLTSLLDTLDWSIETLELVSTIRRLDAPSISNETVGAACSK